MNWLSRLFRKEIRGMDVVKLALALGKSRKLMDSIRTPPSDKYFNALHGFLKVKYQGENVTFDLNVYPTYVLKIPKSLLEINSPIKEYIQGTEIDIKKTIPYEELSKNPVLKKYVKGKSLEKSLAVLSVTSILASAFFISNNITGNAILTNNANSSGIIGAGLFVLGVVSWVFARNI